jgi:transposase
MGTETLDELETLGHYCDADILRLKAEGLSNRQVAREIGVDEKTVRNKGAEKLQNGEIPHPPPRPEWAQKLDELETTAAKNWSSALKALRAINEQVSVDTLFDERFIGFDQVFGPELERAFAWINQLHRRFESGQATRRRA